VAPHFIAEDFVAFVGKDSRSIQLLDAKVGHHIAVDVKMDVHENL